MKISEIFRVDTFNSSVMEKKLSKDVYRKLAETIENGKKIDSSIASPVALAMKEWALDKGASHFAHWFHPLGRGTAEKHDSFLSSESINDIHSEIIESFSKNQLIQAEPDASSFPSGGMRTTFEARGYTVWDPSSPVFVMRGKNGLTMFIPSIFLSYNKDALDTKTPLLKSINVLNNEIISLLSLLKIDTKKIRVNMGPEQEFFLIDRETYLKRPDLIACNRTLLGKKSIKGQKLADHYFGTIPENVLAFMNDLENTAYRLGIPLTTRHKEVAPRQYEFAPIYEALNLAVDHNQLLMEIMPQIARKHSMEVIFHEKPFAGINGSGKHVNWSIQTQEGLNLTDSGKTFGEQMRFFLIIVSILNAIFNHGELLRCSITNAGNEFRLGKNEAPPSIISVFLGKPITKILNKIMENNYESLETLADSVEISLKQLPELLIGNTDRNRTSPFAFTGNKFEFRAVGSSQALAIPNLILNTIVAESVSQIKKTLEIELKSETSINKAIQNTIRCYYSKAQAIVFNGDNYSEEWPEEAKKRNLPNIKRSFEALSILIKDKTVNLFEKYSILSKVEIEALHKVECELMKNLILIEGKTFQEMINKEIIPAIFKYSKNIMNPVENILATGDINFYLDRFRDSFLCLIKEMESFSKHLGNVESNPNVIPEELIEQIRPKMQKIRKIVSYFESNIPEKDWPFPTYFDLLHKF